ncbi:MAG: Gfo/Idh/MocA family oxidoreductase [Planctomycetes bacterium]|nr:Gfo/Idh/MocA family oxidoreductase [Planctomycetota bacterium]
MGSVGVGIIGCGGRVRGLAKMLIQRDPNVKITALCDPRPESIEASKQALNSEAAVYEDCRAMAAAGDVDWVMIGSFNCFHREHAVAAMEAGKHVFCEKPLATTLEDCLAMRDARDRTGRTFYMGFTLRHAPHYRRIRKLLDDGTIGKVVSFEFNETLDFNHGGFIHTDWRRLTKYAGSHLLEKCCHDIDLALWMVGSLPVTVAGFGGLDYFLPANVGEVGRIGPSPTGTVAFNLWRRSTRCTDPFTSDKDILDNQVAIMQFAGGVRATFHANACAGLPERRMYILGTEGAIRADVLTGKIEVRRTGWNEPSTLYDNRGGGHGGGDTVLIDELLAAIHTGAAPAASLEEGLRSAITCFAIDEATRTGRVVDVRPLWKKAAIAVDG